MKHVVRLCQLLLALTFIFSGLVKCVDPVGTAIKLEEYMAHFGLSWLADWSMGMSWALCLAETVVGVHLLLGHRQLGVWPAVLFMSVFTPMTLYIALRNPVDDCGCFGDALRLTNWQTLGKNVVLLTMSVLVAVWRRMVWIPLRRLEGTLYAYYAVALGIGLCWLGTWRLPYIDFRPYRPGRLLVDIGLDDDSEQTADDEEAVALSDIVCIYEKDGVRREFLLDSIPDADSGWEFVETKDIDRIVRERTESMPEREAGHGLQFTDRDFSDVTRETLKSHEYTFLLMSPSLERASENNLDRIETLYEYARQHDYGFYMVTQRNHNQIVQWMQRTGAEYPILYADASEIATVIRANPGLVVVHGATILWKSAITDLDVEELTTDKLSEQTSRNDNENSRLKRFFTLVALLFVPFVLFLLFENVFSLSRDLITNIRNKKV